MAFPAVTASGSSLTDAEAVTPVGQPPDCVSGRRRIGRLKKRAEFLAVAASRRKWVGAGFILQVRAHDDKQSPRPGDPAVRLGYTASRKVGGAVVRNRARRRLRAAVAEVLAPQVRAGHDLVLVARGETVRRPFSALKQDLREALQRLKLLDRPAAGPAAGTTSGLAS